MRTVGLSSYTLTGRSSAGGNVGRASSQTSFAGGNVGRASSPTSFAGGNVGRASSLTSFAVPSDLRTLKDILRKMRDNLCKLTDIIRTFEGNLLTANAHNLTVSVRRVTVEACALEVCNIIREVSSHLRAMCQSYLTRMRPSSECAPPNTARMISKLAILSKKEA